MKKIVYTLAAVVTLLNISCSSDDDNGGNNTTVNTYLPLTDGNSWVYDVSGSLQTGRDSVYIAQDTVIGANTYKRVETLAAPSGFFSNVLRNNGVRKDGDAIKVSGSTTVSVSSDLPFSLAVTDLVVFRENATAGQQLGTVSGTIQQTYEGIPLDFTYTLTTIADETLPTYTVSGHTYTNVKKVKAVINLGIGYNFEGFPVNFLTPQDVITSYQYYAENIGVVNVETTFTYSLEATFAGVLGIPPTATETQQEVLDNYNVN